MDVLLCDIGRLNVCTHSEKRSATRNHGLDTLGNEAHDDSCNVK